MTTCTVHKELVEVQRKVKKQHVEKYYDAYERFCQVEAEFSRNGDPNSCIVTIQLPADVKENDRIVSTEGVWKIKSFQVHNLPPLNELTLVCQRDEFESGWKALEKLGCDLEYGIAVPTFHDEDSERYLDTWVGVFITNIVSHYDEIKNGRHVGEFYHLFGKDVPAVCVGAGPSLDKNCHLLRDFPGIIICSDRAYRSLRARGIDPDIVLSIDCHYDLVAKMLDVPGNKEHTLISNTCTDPKVAKVWDGKLFWYLMKHPGVQFMDYILPALFPKFHGIENVGNVGNSSVLLAEFMGLSPVVLVGQDYGYTDGKMFAKEFVFHRDGKIEEVETDHEALLEKRTGQIEINGIKTYLSYRLYMQTLYDIKLKRGIDIINCTEGGILKDLPCKPLAQVIAELGEMSNMKYVEAKKKIQSI